MKWDQIILASTNAGKLKELQEFLHPFQIDVKSVGELDYDEPEETGTTFEENALIKARAASEQFQKPAIADDSGFQVEAMENGPGVYSSRFAGNDYPKAMQAILDKVNASDTRRAGYQCVIAFIQPDGTEKTFSGEIQGKIAEEPRGENGFGYDPIFIPDGYDQTFAEMASEEKAKISHRAIAMKAFLDWIDQ